MRSGNDIFNSMCCRFAFAEIKVVKVFDDFECKIT